MDKDRKHDDDHDQNEGDDTPKWADMIRRVMSVGLGAAFMTEESIRGALGDIKLPKEVLNNLLQGANRSKEEFLNRIGNETIKLISKIDFVREASRFVEEHKFHISAEIEVVKKEKRGGEGSDHGLQLKTKVKIRD